jgi:hypothetical protein
MPEKPPDNNDKDKVKKPKKPKQPEPSKKTDGGGLPPLPKIFRPDKTKTRTEKPEGVRKAMVEGNIPYLKAAAKKAAETRKRNKAEREALEEDRAERFWQDVADNDLNTLPGEVGGQERLDEIDAYNQSMRAAKEAEERWIENQVRPKTAEDDGETEVFLVGTESLEESDKKRRKAAMAELAAQIEQLDELKQLEEQMSLFGDSSEKGEGGKK